MLRAKMEKVITEAILKSKEDMANEILEEMPRADFLNWSFDPKSDEDGGLDYTEGMGAYVDGGVLEEFENKLGRKVVWEFYVTKTCEIYGYGKPKKEWLEIDGIMATE